MLISPSVAVDEPRHSVPVLHGCYWHGPRCWMTKSQDGKDKWEREADATKFPRARGYRVVEMRECTFRNNMRFNTKLKAFVQDHQPPTPQRKMTESEIMESIVDGRLFGMAEVDIRVPDWRPSHFRHPSMTTAQYFQEMSPIFCTSDVPFDVIGDHMQDHVRAFDLSDEPRRLLVGGTRAKKILLATPLLKWYWKDGLEVTRIYQTVEFRRHACFRDSRDTETFNMERNVRTIFGAK